jgi:zinc/manganese transport system substrate-binding protein
MKKTLFSFLILFLAAGAFAEPLKVVTTTSDLASITKEVGGDKVAVDAMAKGYQDPHFVEAKPSFLMLLREADLLEVVGLELEIGWLPPLIDDSRNDRIKPGTSGYLDVSAGVEILDRPSGKVDRSMGDVHAQGNPHYWTDPANAVRIAMQVHDRLVKLRPQDAPYFDARLNAFKVKMSAAYQRWVAALAPFKGAKVVTYHSSWPNFAKCYGLNVIAYVEPKPGVPPSPSHTFELIGTMKSNGVKAIIVEPYFDLRTPQSIAEKTGAKVVVLYPSVGGKPGLDDYVSLFDYNMKVLADALR